jgi:hypothetical protein
MKVSLILALLCLGDVYAIQPTSCPTRGWFSAEFVSLADKVISGPAVIQDPNLTFFKDIMRFTEREIQQVTEDALQFFKTRFGLDFSQAEPNELGQRIVENAVFAPVILSPEIQYTITYNRWIISGNTNNLCFENRDGGYAVSFTGDQVLRGEYGGEEGRPIGEGGPNLAYGFYNIPVCPQEPLVIRYSSNTPARVEPIDGTAVINCDLSHRVWGPGIAQGSFQITPTEDGRTRVTIRNILTFPPHPLI